GQQVEVAPERARPGLDLLARQRPGDRLVVVRGLDRAEARVAVQACVQRMLRTTVGADECGHVHGKAPLEFRHVHICRARPEPFPLDLAPGALRVDGAPGCRGFTGPVPSASLDAAPSRTSGPRVQLTESARGPEYLSTYFSELAAATAIGRSWCCAHSVH